MDINIMLDKLKEYYSIRFLKELAEKIKMPVNTVRVWKARNCTALLMDRLMEADQEALEYILISKKTSSIGNIKLNSILYARISEEARKFGVDLNQYAEHLLIQSLRKAS